jgi:hypothetical protein
MGWGVWHVRGRGEVHIKFLWGNLKERVHLEDLDIDESVILKFILSTWFVQKVSGFTTGHEVDKAYGVLTLIVFNIFPIRSYTLRPTILPLLETFCELLFQVSNIIVS